MIKLGAPIPVLQATTSLSRKPTAVDDLAQNRHGLSQTRHTFPDSLVGNGEGGGVPAVCRVYMNWGAAR